jgi:hypothetical protein
VGFGGLGREAISVILQRGFCERFKVEKGVVTDTPRSSQFDPAEGAMNITQLDGPVTRKGHGEAAYFIAPK